MVSQNNGESEKKRSEEADKREAGEEAPRNSKPAEEESVAANDDEEDAADGEEEAREEDRADGDESPEDGHPRYDPYGWDWVNKDGFEDNFGFLGYGRNKGRDGREQDNRVADYHQQQRMHSFNRPLLTERTRQVKY